MVYSRATAIRRAASYAPRRARPSSLTAENKVSNIPFERPTVALSKERESGRKKSGETLSSLAPPRPRLQQPDASVEPGWKLIPWF